MAPWKTNRVIRENKDKQWMEWQSYWYHIHSHPNPQQASYDAVLSASLLRWGGLLLKGLSVILSCDGPGFVIFLKTHGDCIFLLFDFRIRVYKSFSRGSKMKRVFSGIPDAKSIKETFNKPSSKWVYLYLKTDTPGTV